MCTFAKRPKTTWDVEKNMSYVEKTTSDMGKTTSDYFLLIASSSKTKTCKEVELFA